MSKVLVKHSFLMKIKVAGPLFLEEKTWWRALTLGVAGGKLLSYKKNFVGWPLLRLL